jgi:hypothetical protein
MESLAPANSLADSLGYNLPFKNVSMPSGAYSPERFGFELQIWVADIDETIASDEDEAVVEGTVSEGEVTAEEVEQRILHDTVLEQQIHQKKTAFEQLTKMPWVPFNDDSTPIGVEQRQLFIEMESHYSRHAQPSADNGYNKF